MNNELEQALSNANYRITFENQKQKLQEILSGNLVYAYNGGYFNLGVELFMEVQLFLNENTNSFTLLDQYMNPIEVQDGKSFYKDIRSQYTQAINKYRMDLAKLKHSRDTKRVVQVALEDDIEE